MRAFALSAVCLSLTAVSTLRAEVVGPPAISTSGQATIYVTPDRAVITFGIRSVDARLDKAREANDSANQQFLKALTDGGVERQDIQSSQISVEVIGNRDDQSRVAAYAVTRQYGITLKDLKKLDELIQTGLENGANQLQGVSFETSQLRKYRDQARRAAIVAAKEKAADLASQLNCGLGPCRQIVEGSLSNSWQDPTANSIQSVVRVQPDDDSGAAPVGQIEVSAQISVTFELKN